MEWYHDPERYVDAVDIEKHGKGAVQLLHDLIVNRHTEHEKLAKMFFTALSRPVRLIDSQKETLRLAMEARKMGLNEAQYLVHKLGIHQSSAYRRLETLNNRMRIITYQNEVKTANFDDNQAIDNDTRMKITNAQKDAVIGGWRIECLTKNENPDTCKGVARAYFGLCSSCYNTYFKNPRYYPDGPPDWVEFLILDNRKEQRALAAEYIRDMRLNPLDITEVA